MKKTLAKMKNRLLIVCCLICLALLMNACATFKKPTTINETNVHKRALSKESNGIRASAAVVGDHEARQIFGIDLSQKNMQAVWVEIENNSDRLLILLPTAIDSEYFAPLEVAFAYHQFFATDANAALNEHLLNLNFPIRSPIAQSSRASGYIFTNWKKGMKVIDIDLLGDAFIQNFTFFAPNPDSILGQDIIHRIVTMFSAVELQNVKSEVALREALVQLPCCVSRQSGGPSGPSAEPLNVIIVGAIEDWTTAFVRRDYHHQVLSPRYVFGRKPDISAKKVNRGYLKAQAHTIRLWQTPIRYHGKPVWVGQFSLRQGGRFAEKAHDEVTLPLDPHVDEARFHLAQDMAYSQALLKIGFVKGSGQSRSTLAEKESEDVYYTTDGLRVVLVFGERPSSLEEIDFFNWERLADYQ